MFVIGNTWLWLLDFDSLPGSVFLSWLFASLPVGLPPALKKLARDVGTKPALLDEALRGDWGFLGDDTTFLGEFNFPVIGQTLRIQAKSHAQYILYCYHKEGNIHTGRVASFDSGAVAAIIAEVGGFLSVDTLDVHLVGLSGFL